MWFTFVVPFFTLHVLSLGEETVNLAEPQNSIHGANIGTGINKTWLEHLLKREWFNYGVDIDDVRVVTISPFDSPGSNYGSNRTKVELSFALPTCDTMNASVIVVEFPDAPERKKQLSDAGLFVTDINVYEKVLPKMDALLYEMNDFGKRSWVKPLELVKYSKLILEDLEEMGFQRKDKRDGLDMKHCKVAVEGLAKFHALSAILQSKDLISVADFDLSLSQRNSKGIGDWYGNLLSKFAQYFRAAWGPEWESTAQIIEKKSKTATSEQLELLKRNDSKFNVLLNGDFSITNLFFNKGCSEGCSSPTATKVINFQNSFWNTPVLDLQTFLNTSPNPEIITSDSLRDEIITHYTTQLMSFLKFYGYEGNVTVEDIKSEVRRTELIGFLNAVNHLSGMYLGPEDAAYAEKFIVDALKNKQIKIDSKGMVLPRFIQVMKKLVTRAQKLGVL